MLLRLVLFSGGRGREVLRSSSNLSSANFGVYSILGSPSDGAVRPALRMPTLTSPTQPRRGEAHGPVARLLLGPGGGRRGPHGSSVRRGLHQLTEDPLRAGLRLARPRRGSLDPAGGRAHGVHLAVGAGAGTGDGRRRGAGGRARRLGLDRGYPTAATAELADDEARFARVFRGACSDGSDRHGTRHSWGITVLAGGLGGLY